SDAHVERSLQVGADVVEHRKHTGDVKASDDYGNTGLAERLCDVQRSRELIRLNPDQPNKAKIIVRAHFADDAIDTQASISFVDSDDFYFRFGTEDLALRAIVNESINAGQRIRRHWRAVPANNIAVVIVIGRLYQHDAKTITCSDRCSRMPKG